MSRLLHTLEVDLGERSYPVYIGSQLLADARLLQQHIAGSQLVLVSNETVAPLYRETVRGALGAALQVTEVVLPDGEQHKSMAVLQQIFDQVLSQNHNRSTTFVALGGGVIGDITGFAAACYQRGVDFLQLPTTLLAQVDSSVGGKTAVNHPLGKNMIGAFHQPRAVIIDTDTLATLPAREYAAGLAEVVKYGLIGDPAFYAWLQAQLPGLLAREPELVAEAIQRSCANKAAVVAADEREGGQRALLNLGHTFGHAIETASGYGNWLHGEAVAAGMVMAAALSARRGLIADEAVAQLAALLRSMSLPVEPPAAMTGEEFVALMFRDKKVIDGRLRLILLRDIGDAFIADDVSRDELQEFLADFGSQVVASRM